LFVFYFKKNFRRRDKRGITYKFQLYCDFVFKLWNTLNENNKKDYSFLLYTKSWREAIDLREKGITHGTIENQGTENHNKTVKRQIDKGNAKDVCLSTLIEHWIINLLRTEFTLLFVSNQVKNKKTIYPLKVYFSNVGVPKKLAPLISNKPTNYTVLLKISGDLLIRFVGPLNLIENKENYKKIQRFDRKNKRLKTEYALDTK
jgi:hypothetical protein